jgi:hypothetical protein
MLRVLVVLVAVAGSAVADPKKNACAITGTSKGNTPFDRAATLLPADKEKDPEYAIVERASHAGTTFYLRHGHGVIRLEAWSEGKRVAATFVPNGRDPAYSDWLSLEVRTLNGTYVEAQCRDAMAIHKL